MPTSGWISLVAGHKVSRFFTRSTDRITHDRQQHPNEPTTLDSTTLVIYFNYLLLI